MGVLEGLNRIYDIWLILGVEIVCERRVRAQLRGV